MHLNANLAEAEQVPGVLNIVFDGLSRNVSTEELGLDPLLMYNAAADDPITVLRLIFRNKSGYNNTFCAAKTITKAHLQNHDKLNGIARRCSVSEKL